MELLLPDENELPNMESQQYNHHPIENIINFLPNRVGLIGYIYEPDMDELEPLTMSIDRAFHKLTNLLTVCAIYTGNYFYIFIIPKYKSHWVYKMLYYRNFLYNIFHIYSGREKCVKLSNDYKNPIPCDLLFKTLNALDEHSSIYIVGENDPELIDYIKQLPMNLVLKYGQIHDPNSQYGIIMATRPKRYN